MEQSTQLVTALTYQHRTLNRIRKKFTLGKTKTKICIFRDLSTDTKEQSTRLVTELTQTLKIQHKKKENFRQKEMKDKKKHTPSYMFCTVCIRHPPSGQMLRIPMAQSRNRRCAKL